MNEQLEVLLNKLIEKGWKPRAREKDKDIRIITGPYTSIRIGNNFIDGVLIRSVNDLCSIDSGLWQFVCEKGLVKYIDKSFNIWENVVMGQDCNDNDTGMVAEFEFECTDYEYRLMISSIQEDKIRFLLDNIKLEGTNN